MEYSNSDLIKNTDAKGYAYEYTYDSKHNMTQAKSQNGVTYNYTYSSKGLTTSLEVKGNNVSSLKTEAVYNTTTGYFQSGGGILDANMQAYCGNNPVNCADPMAVLYSHLVLAEALDLFLDTIADIHL